MFPRNSFRYGVKKFCKLTKRHGRIFFAFSLYRHVLRLYQHQRRIFPYAHYARGRAANCWENAGIRKKKNLEIFHEK